MNRISDLRTDLDHLPLSKQNELARVRDIILSEFDAAMTGGTQDWKRQGRILAIILFGSYARGDWVDERHTRKRYQSDFDILIILNHDRLARHSSLWIDVEEKLLWDTSIHTPVHFLPETLQTVNDELSKGQYFFTDIIKQGIALYHKAGVNLATARNLSPEEAHEIASDYFEDRISAAEDFMIDFKASVERGSLKHAAFLLHQSAENAYSAHLLTHTGYCPSTHRLTTLRGFCEDLDRDLVDVWPLDTKKARAAFNLLVDAYVKARYSKHYDISKETLGWLSDRVEDLHRQVRQSCENRIKKLASNLSS